MKAKDAKHRFFSVEVKIMTFYFVKTTIAIYSTMQIGLHVPNIVIKLIQKMISKYNLLHIICVCFYNTIIKKGKGKSDRDRETERQRGREAERQKDRKTAKIVQDSPRLSNETKNVILEIKSCKSLYQRS
jgi:hypothetical protein